MNAGDTYVMLKPRDQWPDPDLPKAELVRRIEEAVRRLPGNNYEFTQPIQMRFNELIAGVRSDVAVKVFGDDFATMNATADQIAGILRTVEGAADVKVEQTEGLPMLDIRPNRDAMARLGITARAMQDTLAAAVGGRDAGMIFEGDRRFAVTIRLGDAQRANFDTLGQVPLPTPDGAFVPLASVADIAVTEGPNQISRENGKRRVVVQANVRGRDVAGVVGDAQGAIARDVKLPPGTYLEWGGQFQNMERALGHLKIIIPITIAAIFFLLFLQV